jgi:uncharacterized membrane protein YgcG
MSADRAERMAALDQALEDCDDDALWKFGTATLRGFVDQLNDDEGDLFEGMLDPDDPLLQPASKRLTATPPWKHLERQGTDAVLRAVDEALLSGDDVSHFDTQTLQAALASRVQASSLDRDITDASQGPVPNMEPRAAQQSSRATLTLNCSGATLTLNASFSPLFAPAPAPAPDPSATRASSHSLGKDSQRSAGAPPAVFPLRDQPMNQPINQPAKRPISLSMHQQQPMSHPIKPPDWKLTDEMMHQRWGSVLQVLTPREPGRLDAKGGGGSCGGGSRGGGSSGGSSGGGSGGGSSVQSLVGASPRATPSGDYYGSAAAVRSAMSSPRHDVMGTTPRTAAYRRMI